MLSTNEITTLPSPILTSCSDGRPPHQHNTQMPEIHTNIHTRESILLWHTCGDISSNPILQRHKHCPSTTQITTLPYHTYSLQAATVIRHMSPNAKVRNTHNIKATCTSHKYARMSMHKSEWGARVAWLATTILLTTTVLRHTNILKSQMRRTESTYHASL